MWPLFVMVHYISCGSLSEHFLMKFVMHYLQNGYQNVDSVLCDYESLIGRGIFPLLCQ